MSPDRVWKANLRLQEALRESTVEAILNTDGCLTTHLQRSHAQVTARESSVPLVAFLRSDSTVMTPSLSTYLLFVSHSWRIVHSNDGGMFINLLAVVLRR